MYAKLFVVCKSFSAILLHFFGSLIIVSKKKFSALFSFQIKDVLNIDKDLIIACWWIANLCLIIAHHMYMSKRYFVHYSECLYNPPSLLSNSNNKSFSYFKDLG